jgi:hypothetical protein
MKLEESVKMLGANQEQWRQRRKTGRAFRRPQSMCCAPDIRRKENVWQLSSRSNVSIPYNDDLIRSSPPTAFMFSVV